MAAMMFPSVAPTVALYARMTRERSAAAPLASRPATCSPGARPESSPSPSRYRRAACSATRSSGIEEAAGSRAESFSPRRCTSSRPSRTSASRSAAVRWDFSSGRGAAGFRARSAWSAARLLVRRLLLGAHGVALRPRRDEHRLDGAGRRAHRGRKTLPWRRTATYGTALVLVALGLLLLAAPEAIPGLTIPDDNGSMLPMDERGPRWDALLYLVASRRHSPSWPIRQRPIPRTSRTRLPEIPPATRSR